jgi:N-acyl-D-amino-acid deacylase
MSRRIHCAWLTGVLVLGLWAVASAQFPGGNPYLPRPAVNPYTGAPLNQTNPLTGQGAAPGMRNPYTGKVMQPNAGINPLTGQPQPGFGGPATGAAEMAPWPQLAPPITGDAGPGLESFDKAVLAMMDRHGIPGGALAIAKNGKLVYAKGFGWADLARKIIVEPNTLFGLGSLSKPITAMAILLLVERGQLDLDDRVYDVLKHIRLPPTIRIDPRVKTITIRQLLNHTGGWDRAVKGDPINWSPQIARAMRLPLPLTDQQFIAYMWSVPLDFTPGTKFQYSNVGYIMLGEVVEAVSGQKYETFVREQVLKPMGIKKAILNAGKRSYQPGEVRRYLAGNGIMLPPMDVPMLQAAGGWEVSAPDMVRFLTALDGSRGKKFLDDKIYRQMVALPPPPVKPRADGNYNGLGWPTVSRAGKSFGYFHDGNYDGVRAFMKCSPARGVNWALLFNVSINPDAVDDRIVLDAVREVREAVESIESYPDVDLFKKY